MAKTVTVTQNNPAGAGQVVRFTAVVANTDAAAAQLTSLVVSEATKGGAFISQPKIQTPNATPGTFPTINAAGTATYNFDITFSAPATPGPSPANQPGGAKPRQPAFPVSAVAQLRIDGQTSDGTVFSNIFAVSVRTVLAPFPEPEDGAAQFGQGGCSNIIAVIM